MLNFRAVTAACPAAATEGKSRRTTQGDYIAYPTRKLFNMATAAGFKCVAALQGPSLKKAYIPFARHMLTFDRAETGVDTPPRFRLVITNSHNGLSPIMFIPALYLPVYDVTMFVSAFAVFHRDFTDEVKFEALVRGAFDAALGVEPAVLHVWNKLARGGALSSRQRSLLLRAIVNTHGGSTVEVPADQMNYPPKWSAGPVAASILSDYMHGRFKSRTAGGKERGIYPSRAIVRIERAAFGAWFEACRLVYGTAESDQPSPRPFNVTPVARDKGTGYRRKSAAVILTGAKQDEAAAD
jgi:hypothetical protein